LESCRASLLLHFLGCISARRVFAEQLYTILMLRYTSSTPIEEQFQGEGGERNAVSKLRLCDLRLPGHCVSQLRQVSEHSWVAGDPGAANWARDGWDATELPRISDLPQQLWAARRALARLSRIWAARRAVPGLSSISRIWAARHAVPGLPGIWATRRALAGLSSISRLWATRHAVARLSRLSGVPRRV
jgi:hypothetical protein